MKLENKLTDALNNLELIKSEVEKGEKDADELERAINTVKDLQAQVDAANEAKKMVKALGKSKKGEEENKAMKNLGQKFVEVIKKQELGKKFSIIAPAFKAASDTQTSPANAVDFATTFDKNIVEGARTPLVVRDLFSSENISGSTLVYLVEGVLEGAPAATAEGATKPQVHFKDPTPKTVSLKKIACYIKESDEYISDYPFLESAINGRLLYELGLVEQNMLVADLVGTSGIQTDSGTWTASSKITEVAELILKSAADVEEQSGFAADGILMNPATWYLLRVAKNSTDDYYGGGFFGVQNVPNIWGIPVCVTTAVSDSQIIVGAFKACGSVVQNDGVAVEATNTNENDFIKNLMTIRAEERLALAVRRPAGFKLLTK